MNEATVTSPTGQRSQLKVCCYKQQWIIFLTLLTTVIYKMKLVFFLVRSETRNLAHKVMKKVFTKPRSSLGTSTKASQATSICYTIYDLNIFGQAKLATSGYDRQQTNVRLRSILSLKSQKEGKKMFFRNVQIVSLCCNMQKHNQHFTMTPQWFTFFNHYTIVRLALNHSCLEWKTCFLCLW